ncbi:arylsulfatase [Bacillus sp. AFS041924]|uniref:arylsulfatase n=1 Tax=Bacillus sp. AFS041924 TaxID=2033503 RepID=UPI000BFDD026|nr:arylsulfatase [Bacillus sp. AFS041924]PGS51216.1 arylsulfatase [Bacillus sp. AFS041924]
MKNNIVYIVLDDMGFSDIGCYGSEIKTPNIDRLAQNGLSYNNFHATPLCSPTRASLLTGRNHHTVGMGVLTNFDLGPDVPNSRGKISTSAGTIAEILKENDYSTYAVGKWHLTPIYEETPAGPFNNWPLGKGFERYYGFLEAAADQYTPTLVYDNHFIDPPKNPDYHLSEDLVDHGIQFLSDHASTFPDKPFFMYLAFGAQHSPHQVSQRYINMYKDTYAKGWDKIREERLERQKLLGIVPQDTVLAERNLGVKEWDKLTLEEKRLFERFQETYAGFLTHTDEQIGRFIEFLETIGQLDNTMIVFLSDNGASQEGEFDGILEQISTYNGIPTFAEKNFDRIDEIGGPNSQPNYPRGWAQASNTPFKYYKQTTFDGGIHVPLIYHYPSRIKDIGTVRNQFHHVIDITPTVLDLAGIGVPKEIKGVKQIPLHGKSMQYTFDNSQSNTTRESQYFLMGGQRAIWHDGWKAIAFHMQGTSFESDQWELYNTIEDFSQSNNFAEKYPEKLNELKEIWFSEAEKFDALPMIDKTFELFSYVSPDDRVRYRTEFTYYPYMGHTYAVPSLLNRSYKITVPIYCESKDSQGVLFAHGNSNSGYTMYIQNNRLYYEYNYVGTVYKIESELGIPVGKSNVRYEFLKTGDYQGKGVLYIDDDHVGEVDMPKTLPFLISIDGFSVGRDAYIPVSKNYAKKGDFPFTGKIHKIDFDLQND